MKNSLKWITTCGSSHAKLNEFICNLNLFELLVWKMHLMHSNWVTTFDFQCKPGISLYFAGVPQFPMNWPIALTYICCIMKHMHYHGIYVQLEWFWIPMKFRRIVPNVMETKQCSVLTLIDRPSSVHSVFGLLPTKNQYVYVQRSISIHKCVWYAKSTLN